MGPHDPPQLDDEEKPLPRIVLYAENKKAAQAILNKIYNAFPNANELGEDLTPRYNQKVNNLIYYAQGSADIKTASSGAKELFEEDMVHFKGKGNKLKVPKD